MKSFYKILLLALLGIFFASYMIFFSGSGQQTVVMQAQVKIPPPFTDFVYGSGVVEAASMNIPVATTLAGVVSKLYVTSGQEIKQGEPLFTIDEREINAKIAVAKAKIKVAQATRTQVTHQFQIEQNLKKIKPSAVNKKVYLSLQDEMGIAKDKLQLAQAELAALESTLQRHTVFSPIDGQVLQCKMRVGEYITTQPPAVPLMLLGSDALNLRVDINENDLWRLGSTNQAVAFIRNHAELKIPLEFGFKEPFIVAKTALTGSNTERTDLRVLQFIYHIQSSDIPLYVGQQLDVFIQAGAIKTAVRQP